MADSLPRLFLKGYLLIIVWPSKLGPKLLAIKKKGKLYGAGNLAANYRKGVATTLKFTLNHGEGSSQQPVLTPEMRELIQRLTQEQLAQQMASHEAVVRDLLSRQQRYEEQLAEFRQAREVGNSSQQSSVPDPNVEPFPSYSEDGGEEEGEDMDSDSDDEE
jgi:hypothetical protein